MAPLSRTAVVALAALTVEYSVMSIVLHISRQPKADGRPQFHASSAVLLTEFFKIIVSTVLVFWSRELRPKMLEMKKVRNARENAQEVEPEQEWIKDEKSDAVDAPPAHEVHETWVEPPVRKTRRADSLRTNSLRVNVSAAQATPQLAIIPATPANPPSPARVTDSTALHPTRIPFQAQMFGSGVVDVLDPDAWVALRKVVLSEGWWKLAIPSAMFMFQANAQYVASGNLSVPVFQLAYQLKIPATALCSVFLLKRVLTGQQWVSLCLLTVGVGVVQLASLTPSDNASRNHPTGEGPNELLGLAAVGAACLSSGFASTYFERILKAPSTLIPGRPSIPPPSIWVRNIQLSLFGLLIAFVVVYYHIRGEWSLGDFEGDWWEGAQLTVKGFWASFFEGFSGITWMVVVLQVTGGLLGALVQQHADNIAKCFSTSISILISFLASVAMFGFAITYGFAFGASLVILSTWVYTVPGGLWRWRRRSAGAPSSPASMLGHSVTGSVHHA